MKEERNDMPMQRILVPLATFFWWKRLSHRSNADPNIWVRDHIVKVKGWRTMLVDTWGRGRETVTFLFGKHF